MLADDRTGDDEEDNDDSSDGEGVEVGKNAENSRKYIQFYLELGTGCSTD